MAGYYIHHSINYASEQRLVLPLKMRHDDTTTVAHRDEAVYYHNDVHGSRILARILGPHLAGRVLEVGAGAGYITTELAERCSEVVAIEPTKELHHTLITHTQTHTNVTVVNAILSDYVRSRPTASGSSAGTTTGAPGDLFDAVVYINVLEHIEHDGAELALATSLLRPGGRVLIVVPAHQWLYAKVDRLTGHFRRYSKKSLLAVTRDNGLRIESMRYFDSVGLVPYLVLYKWLRSTATTGTNATIYSRVIMPISYLIYRIFRGHVIGKNLIVVAAIAS